MCGPDGAPPEAAKEDTAPLLRRPARRRTFHSHGSSRGHVAKPDQNRTAITIGGYSCRHSDFLRVISVSSR
ncbi:hypothetical protein FRAHR75_350086 [Frankia sp. Hr75.2]|nr:hypothetical protein FRAHR75_350086 [Frankia sp. Hr75.2]